MPVIIFNKHQEFDASWCDEVVNVMRPHTLQNPTPITSVTTRTVAIQKCRTYFAQQMRRNTPQRTEISRLQALHRAGKNIGLICCCTPLPCHADIIKEWIIGDRVTGI